MKEGDLRVSSAKWFDEGSWTVGRHSGSLLAHSTWICTQPRALAYAPWHITLWFAPASFFCYTQQAQNVCGKRDIVLLTTRKDAHWSH